MARSALKFDDATHAALLTAARDADAAHPNSNPEFLDTFLSGAWLAARRIYGAQTYLRLMAQAGVTRRPSAGTVQKAIVRMRTMYEAPLAVPLRGQPRSTQPVWTPQMEWNLARSMSLLDVIPESSNLTNAGEADVVNATRRALQLERENLELRARLAQMTVAATYAHEALRETLSEQTHTP